MQFAPLGEIPITKTKTYSIEKEMHTFLHRALPKIYSKKPSSFRGAKRKKPIKKKKKTNSQTKNQKKNTFPLENTAKNQLPPDLNEETTTLQKTKVFENTEKFPLLMTMLFQLILFPTINNNKTKKANTKIQKK